MIEIKNLKKNYTSVHALNGIDLNISRGEIIGLFGENGAGKTTFMKSILGLTSFSGEITLDGQPINRKNIARLSFGTCEHSFFPTLTATEHKEFYQTHFENFRSKRFDALMDFFELSKHRKLKQFSTGQQNQFEVIMALCQGADYIFLDEPFAGNDIFNREDFYKVLLGILEPTESVILSTHLIEEVSGFIGRALLIHKGKIVGDVQVADLEEQGQTLVDYVKQTYNYQPDRVAKALGKLTE